MSQQKIVTDDAGVGVAAVERAVPEGQSPLFLERYKFNNKRRGKAVIINNKHFDYRLTYQLDRDGTDVDAEILERIFIKFGFEVVRLDDQRTLDMSMNLREIASEDHSDADCFVCAILSHGDEGKIYGTNGTLTLDSITKRFKGEECPSLAGKPKLFFIQACRGRKYDWGAEVRSAVPDSDSIDASPVEEESVRTIPIEADVLIAYSVAPGYFSWRNNVDGSWFIQALARVLEEHGKSMEIMRMMTLVNKLVAYDFESCTDDDFTSGMKQVPCFASTLTKEVYF